ncbi:zinc finger CCCH domain-containing protein 22 isoform X2 [Tripterygium wilfordii]|uniref:zinc finger CCCH domain-containing protein 22 isoform X2 n=1 Tax=Tripterygium wilfordii TaxID=458696 RepID=UPI0018F811B5|nr:zinc finger CCCH domain-containing protein 22 isoform X2 [Tripterygium wilfordii]
MANEEERILENQLELQLEEQRDSLAALKEALASDPSNAELISVHEELVLAIQDAEEGLLQLKRARLLREADSVLYGTCRADEDVKSEPRDATDIEPELLEEQIYSVGSKCRFRYSDGRWYNGQIVELQGSGWAKISFLTPTAENMLICKFFLQQRCRFGSNCRLSHGVDVSLSSLKRYVPTMWEQSLVGSTVWAIPDSNTGVWREAELKSWDSELRIGEVAFRGGGGSAKLGIEAIESSEYAQMNDEEESYSSSDQSDSSDYEEDSSQGLGFLESTTSQRGIQKETAIFTKWENHTRGIASRMMANMGYREGMGLGASGQGMLDPILVKVLKPKQSLDHALQSIEDKGGNESHRKKRSRGGKRKRDKKFAAATQAAKAKEDSKVDIFSLINNQLAMQGEALNGGSLKKHPRNGSEDRQVDRRALVAYDDEIKDLRVQVEKLEEMVSRNRNEKVVYEAALRKLNETRKSLADAEAAHASASNAVVSKEKEKKWLKF